MSSTAACYVALDGPDGCGKSSQAAALVEWFETQGRAVLHVREPGSTPVGESLRQVLLSPDTGELQPISEALLFSAARCELIHRTVVPALRRGVSVVAERCYLSTAVYQLFAGRPEPGVLDLEWFEDLTRRVHGACLPDAIFVLDVPVAVSLERRRGRANDRIEARGDDYHRRVRDGFVELAAREPRAVVVDAARSFDAVQRELRERVGRLL